MRVRFNIVDVFTNVAFAGNQLGVFTDARGLSDEQMQRLATELGFSECTFVLPPQAGGNARIRIFTPKRELPFAGHPVLGTAFVLGAPMQLGQVVLETGAGLVPVVLEREGSLIIAGHMSQPVPTWGAFERADELLAALRIERSLLPVEVYDNGMEHVYVALCSDEEVAAVSLDFEALAAIAGPAGVSTFHADGGRAKTRVFTPADGVAEDAATGSAAGPLAVHLARHGLSSWGEEITISQGAELGRPSTLVAAAFGSEQEVTAVEVSGSAVVVGRGEFEIRG